MLMIPSLVNPVIIASGYNQAWVTSVRTQGEFQFSKPKQPRTRLWIRYRCQDKNITVDRQFWFIFCVIILYIIKGPEPIAAAVILNYLIDTK
jgi:hypothetical protein